MDNIKNALKNYVKSWNQSIDSKLFFDILSDRITIKTDKSDIILWISYGKVLEGHVYDQILKHWDSKLANRFITDLYSISWDWNPREIRSMLINPALLRYKSLFPRFGLKPNYSSDIPITWLDNIKSIEDCRHHIQWTKQREICFNIYRQESPDSNHLLVSECSTFTKKTKHKHNNIDLSKIVDSDADGDDLCCVVCMTNKPCIAAKCGHLATCGFCAQKISNTPNPKCPKCRGEWENLCRIFV